MSRVCLFLRMGLQRDLVDDPVTVRNRPLNTIALGKQKQDLPKDIYRQANSPVKK